MLLSNPMDPADIIKRKVQTKENRKSKDRKSKEKKCEMI